jgi:ubiquinone/menaquinone biosynthesis C-methylase UbiE
MPSASTELGRNLEWSYRTSSRTTSLVSPPAKVLDVGCGSGEPLARYFIERGYEVTGVDVVEEMLEMCRARFPQMKWLHGDMRRLDIHERFEIVIAWDSYFHLPPDDQRRMFGTFCNHTSPGKVYKNQLSPLK